jgi:hypothetical protein
VDRPSLLSSEDCWVGLPFEEPSRFPGDDVESVLSPIVMEVRS